MTAGQEMIQAAERLGGHSRVGYADELADLLRTIAAWVDFEQRMASGALAVWQEHALHVARSINNCDPGEM